MHIEWKNSLITGCVTEKRAHVIFHRTRVNGTVTFYQTWLLVILMNWVKYLYKFDTTGTMSRVGRRVLPVYLGIIY